MTWLVLVKLAHVALAVLSILGFVLRAIWMLAGSPLLDARAVRIVPHVLDTVLLASGLTLAIGWSISPFANAWFAAKLAALVVYIAAGSIALRRGRNRCVRTVALAVALASAGYIVAVALAKSPLPGGWSGA